MSDRREKIKRHEYNHWDEDRMISVRVRQVFSDDPSPEWTDELIQLCELSGKYDPSWVVELIKSHLAKRGER